MNCPLKTAGLSFAKKKTPSQVRLKNVQQSISSSICFFYDSAGVFSKRDFAGSPKHTKKHYYIVLSHLIVTIMLGK